MTFATESDLIAVHASQPLVARWFAVAAYLLDEGYTVERYAADGLDASQADGPERHAVEMYIDDDEDDDQACYWGMEWTANAGQAYESQERDENHCPSWSTATAELLKVLQGL